MIRKKRRRKKKKRKEEINQTIFHSLNDASVGLKDSLAQLVDILNHIVVILGSPHRTGLLEDGHADVEVV